MKQKFKEEGQTLIETLAAIALATVVIVAMVSLGIASQRNANFSRNTLLATKFSQEGAEAVRSIRDDGSRSAISSCFGNTTWDSFWSGQVLSLCGGTLFSLSFDSSLNKWNLAKNSTPEVIQTIFKRQVDISDAAATYDSEKTVTVTVWWEDASGRHESKLIEKLTKWK